jgi:hypothetical protein
MNSRVPLNLHWTKINKTSCMCFYLNNFLRDRLRKRQAMRIWVLTLTLWFSVIISKFKYQRYRCWTNCFKKVFFKSKISKNLNSTGTLWLIFKPTGWANLQLKSWISTKCFFLQCTKPSLFHFLSSWYKPSTQCKASPIMFSCRPWWTLSNRS